MPIAPAPPARGGPTDPSHDEELRRGILHTSVSRRVATFLVATFILTIFAIPVGQIILERKRGDESVLPDLFSRWPTQETIKQFEEDLEKASYPRESIRPHLQELLTRFGRFGNSKAVVGRNGWLFYQPGIVAVSGPGMLDPSLLDSRARAARDAGEDAVYPDPRPPILAFHAYLASRGIKLILFPVPDKAGLQPRELHGRSPDGALLSGRNPDHARLMAELEAAGVLVFDPTPPRLDPARPPRFLQQDTHWTPEWMGEVAGSLAGYLRGHVPELFAGTEPAKTWSATSKRVARVGDVVDMLGLPRAQTLFAPQTVVIEEVRDAAGAPFDAAPGAAILLLGDSFANVYTLAQMGWGESAGLAPQLARFLQRDLDVIAQNDAGAFATRRLLWNELSSAGEQRTDGSPDRLTGKKVVIWEFASRELAVGNWKPLAWPTPPALSAGGPGVDRPKRKPASTLDSAAGEPRP